MAFDSPGIPLGSAPLNQWCVSDGSADLIRAPA